MSMLAEQAVAEWNCECKAQSRIDMTDLSSSTFATSFLIDGRGR